MSTSQLQPRQTQRWETHRSKGTHGAARRGRVAVLIALGLIGSLLALLPIAPAGAVSSSTPVVVSGTEPQWQATSVVSANNSTLDNGHSCASTTAGGVKCWGRGADGQLGNGGTDAVNEYPLDVKLRTDQGAPSVPTSSETGALVAAAGTHSCAIVNTPTLTGAVQCWGDNAFGQLGNATTVDALTPVYVAAGAAPGTSGFLTGAIAIAAGGENTGGSFHDGRTCALVAGGAVYCWGRNSVGQLGNGNTVNQSAPVLAVASGATEISLGGNHACVVMTTGGAKCWGDGGDRALGTGSTANQSSPATVMANSTTALAGVSAISAGGDHTCAIVSGSAKCWGQGNQGQLGNGASVGEFYPVAVISLSGTVLAVSAGGSHSCALTASAMQCWGLNTNFQLGTNAVSTSSTPLTIPDVGGIGSLTRVANRHVGAISAGTSTTCARLVSGSVLCFGESTSGEVGSGVTGSQISPLYVNGSQTPASWKAASVAAGNYIDPSVLNVDETACAITAAGGVKCWGESTYGQAGVATATNRAPVDVALSTAGGASPAAVISDDAGPYITTGGHTCVVVNTATTTGGVQCFGLNRSASKILGSTFTGASTEVPQIVNAGAGPAAPDGKLSGVTSIAGGGRDGVSQEPQATCAVSGGKVYCWGVNSTGALGNGSTTNSPTPVAVSGIASGATQVAMGDGFGCAVVSGGVRCWGDGTSGQLGNGATANQTAPVTVYVGASGTTPLSGVATVTAGTDHACARTTAGAAYCWGLGTNGRLGTGNTTSQTRATAVSGLTSGVTSISAGHTHTCAVLSSGEARCWGDNGNLALGDGTSTNRTVPTPVVSVGGSVSLTGLRQGPFAIAAGGQFTCAAQAVGRALCWGNEDVSGVLGRGTIVPSSSADNNLPAATDQTGIDVEVGDSEVINVAVTDEDHWTDAIYGGVHGDETPTVSVTQPAAGGLVACGTFAPTSAASGTFPCTYTVPSGTATGPFSFQYTVTDSHGGSGSGTITGTLVAVAPTANGQTVPAPRGVDTHIVLTGTDPNGDPITYLVVDQPTKGTLDCNGLFGEDCTYTAGPGQTGADSFTFRTSDGTHQSPPATVNLNITNQAPTADAVVASAPRGVATEVVLTGNDVNGDPITFGVVSQPTKGAVTCSNAGICSYTADTGSSGTDTFTYKVNDGTLDSAAPATATITITNQAPIADARSVNAGKHVATPITLSGSDPNTDPVTFSVVDQPGKGTVDCTGSAGSECTYLSNVGQSGTDSFTYRAFDGDAYSSPVTVTVNLENSPPAANPQSVDAPRGVATPVTLSGGDDNGDSTTFAVVDQPGKGTVACAGAAGADCTYTANPGTSGTDSFTFKANDGESDSAPATVTITITNQAPTANAQTILANAPTTSTPITLTANDPNGDDLGYTALTQPAKGTLSCTATDCSYIATAGRTGTDSFTFRVDDGFGGTSTATVNITLDATTPGVFIGDADMLEPEMDPNLVLQGPMVPVTLSRTSAQPVTIWYYTTPGTALPQGIGTGDYRTWGTPTKPLSVTIPAGKLQTAIAPPVHGDNLVESIESFRVRIVAVTGGANYIGESEGTVRIIDTDTVSNGDPVIDLAGATETEGNAGNRVIQFRIHLSRPSTVPIKLGFTSSNGTAVAGTDYRAVNTTATMAPGETSRTIDVLVYPNTNVNALMRSFSLNMTVISGPALNVQATTATAVLRDED